MDKGNQKVNGSWGGGMISMGKDIVSLLRDAFLLILVFLLILFPIKFNKILVDAGFEEGSFVGFKWKSQVMESQEALKEAEAAILDLKRQNTELAAELDRAKTRINDPETTERISRLKLDNQKLNEATSRVQESVSQTIESNLPLVEKARSSKSLQVFRQISPSPTR